MLIPNWVHKSGTKPELPLLEEHVPGPLYFAVYIWYFLLLLGWGILKVALPILRVAGRVVFHLMVLAGNWINDWLQWLRRTIIWPAVKLIWRKVLGPVLAFTWTFILQPLIGALSKFIQRHFGKLLVAALVVTIPYIYICLNQNTPWLRCDPCAKPQRRSVPPPWLYLACCGILLLSQASDLGI